MDEKKIREQAKELVTRKVVCKLQDYKNDPSEDLNEFEHSLSVLASALESSQTGDDYDIAWRILLRMITAHPQSLKRALEALTAESKLELKASVPESTITATSVILVKPDVNLAFGFWLIEAMTPLKNMKDEKADFIILIICAAVHMLLLKLEEMVHERIDIVDRKEQAVKDRKYGTKGKQMYTV